MMIRSVTLFLAATSALTAPALAQEAPPLATTTAQTPPSELVIGEGDRSERTIIAVPAFATPANVPTKAEGGDTQTLGRNIAQIITSNLERSGLYKPMGPGQVRAISYGEVAAPQFGSWKGIGAEALVQGFVRANPDGNLTVGCYLYDIDLGSEQARQGFVVTPGDWRRAAHKCSDMIYSRLSGESPFFDSRIAYIAETGPKGNRKKQLAIMDSDGGNHKFITAGSSIALTPRFSPNYKSILYLSYVGGRPRIYIYDLASGKQKLVVENNNPTLAPRWSPDGRTILYSMGEAGNTDIYKISANGGTPQRLTNSPGIDVGGSFSPDGSKIVFESDRSGGQQLYVMNADGSNQQRISHGGGRYATPEWSPRGDLISFTKMAGNFRIGVMTPSGGGERLLTNSWQDEAPTWAPNGRVIQFFRTSQGRDGKSSVWQVDVTGVNERKLPTPVDGSDPAWGPILQ